MRRYTQTQEENIRAEQQVREWARSGLLEPVQADGMRAGLRVDLRRTNLFLRLLLFAFGMVIVLAAVGLAAIRLDFEQEPLAILMIASGMACIGLADAVIARYRLYRFGFEEALAAGGVLLVSAGAAVWVSSYETRSELPLFAGCLVAAVAAFVVYARFGYVYEACGAILALCASGFQLGLTPAIERLFVAAVLVSTFVVVRSRRRVHGDDYPGDEYGLLQALAWAALYATLNLHLLDSPPGGRFPSFFYWSTYVLTWALPAVGVAIAVRDKDRPLLDTAVATALLTLVTNKPYLGAVRQAWDPALFGLLLIGVAAGMRRYLSSGAGGRRNGFTPVRILHSDKRAIAMVGTASVVVQPNAAPSPDPDGMKPGGGRSGGAGVSGNF